VSQETHDHPEVQSVSEVKDYNGDDMKINLIRCKTCPFNKNGDPVVRATVQYRVLNIGTQHCHHTNNKTLCRGARDFQIGVLHKSGFLESPTEEAWQKKCDEMGIKNYAS